MHFKSRRIAATIEGGHGVCVSAIGIFGRLVLCRPCLVASVSFTCFALFLILIFACRSFCFSLFFACPFICSFFSSSSTKKRPSRFFIGRLFEKALLDMYEVHCLDYKPLQEFGVSGEWTTTFTKCNRYIYLFL